MSVFGFVKRAVLIGILALPAGMSQAAVVTFDFTGMTDSVNSLTFSEGGLDLTVGAARINRQTGAIISTALVTRTSGGGLGARSGRKDTSDRLDGRGSSELLQFFFSSAVTIEAVTFAVIDDRSKAVHYINGFIGGEGTVARSDLFGIGRSVEDFGIGAKNRASAFRISSISVSYAAVPLPAGGVLLLTGLAGIAGLRRRRFGIASAA